ncbi:hypothetical protein ACMGDH_01665 [Sphingomonas sp. DT-207]|uniref:hypothetical protein n=1 Tax=Sphingomonas sp. DT-207 TaxID=3396167 RepID=UPI003F1AE3CC
MPASIYQRRPNGLDRPRYFDRQLLIADDLALEQGFADHRLALLARSTLGWGVAAGLRLTISPESQPSAAAGGSDLMVSPGFGLTPLGHQVYLTQQLVFEDVAAIIRATCRETIDCRDVDGSVREAAAVASASIFAWIVARPAEVEGGPRPAMPVGCGHSGNSMHPSRRCGGVRVEVVCAIPPPHCDPDPDLDALHEMVCGPWGPPLPPEYSVEADLVVLGTVEVVPEGVFATPRNRRIIPRLDRLGEMVCALHDMPTRYVTHIRPDETDSDRSIDMLAGFDSDGTRFIETLGEAVANVEAGVTYRTAAASVTGRKLRKRTRARRKYLQTEGDGLPPNNLESLPTIGEPRR